MIYNYWVLVSSHGSPLGKIRASDHRTPVEIRSAWFAAIEAYQRRVQKYDHEAQLANMRNSRVGKQAEEGLQDPDLDDVQAPPLDSVDEVEFVTFRGREDGDGYAVALGNVILGIECAGASP